MSTRYQFGLRRALVSIASMRSICESPFTLSIM